MTKKRALMGRGQGSAGKKKKPWSGRKRKHATALGHYALTITIGLVAGVIGGLLTNRILKII